MFPLGLPTGRRHNHSLNLAELVAWNFCGFLKSQKLKIPIGLARFQLLDPQASFHCVRRLRLAPRCERVTGQFRANSEKLKKTRNHVVCELKIASIQCATRFVFHSWPKKEDRHFAFPEDSPSELVSEIATKTTGEFRNGTAGSSSW